MGSDREPIVLVSGGFDPVHDGHIALLEDAARYGRVIVALNSDEWLLKKKGYYFMPFDVRQKVLLAITYVHDVIAVDDFDGTVCDALREIKPDIFANGGDRRYADLSEDAYCKLHKIHQFFGIGGMEKKNSSSELMEKAFDNYKNTLSH
jgi:cytidyltransferase-like protein